MNSVTEKSSGHFVIYVPSQKQTTEWSWCDDAASRGGLRSDGKGAARAGFVAAGLARFLGDSLTVFLACQVYSVEGADAVIYRVSCH